MPASRPPKSPPGKPTHPAGPESKTPGTTVGRVVHDDRGNAVWEWGEDATRSDSTSKVLRRLDVPDLEFEGQEDTARKNRAPGGGQSKPSQHNAPKAPTRAPIVDAGGGYNPYNLTVPVKKQSTAKKPATPKGSGKRPR
jgi:hypothetical protein